MIIGVDAGGTNVDAVLYDGDQVRTKEKRPSDDLIEAVGTVLEGVTEEADSGNLERIVVGTTLVLNAALEDCLPECSNILIPGPGLSPSLAYAGEQNLVADGYVDHRGRVVEELRFQDSVEGKVAAITGKFSGRNPRLEKDLAEQISLSGEKIALGSEATTKLGFPARAKTAVINAKARPEFRRFCSALTKKKQDMKIDSLPLYFMKGDGGILAEQTMRKIPAETVRSGPVMSAIGLSYLAGESTALCVDIGGTTTDITRVRDGVPECTTGGFKIDGIPVCYEAVRSLDIAAGGDTAFEEGALTGQRHGKSVAFGGDVPTPTDALHVVGSFQKGDVERARNALSSLGEPETIAEQILNQTVERIVEGIRSFVNGEDYRPEKILLGGVIAPYLSDRIQDCVSWSTEVMVPEHHEVAGAVGAAVSRVRVLTRIHIDSAEGYMQVSGAGYEIRKSVPENKTYSDEEIESLAGEWAREMAKRAGGTGEGAVDIFDLRRFNVVEQARVEGEIIDVNSQLALQEITEF